jgi:hypothetical protein
VAARVLARAVEVALIGALGLLVLWLVWASRRWPLVHDAPIMHYIAWRISEGAAPYRDLFDMNFPGVYLFHLAVVRLLGTGDAAWRAVDLGATLVTALLVAALAAPWGRIAATGGPLVFAAYHLAGGAWVAGQRDFLLCPFLLAGALGVAAWAEGSSAWSLVGGGIALGAGLTIKPHAVLFVAALAVFIVARARRAGSGALVPVTGLVLGAALLPLAVTAWVAARGALGAWREIVFDYLIPLYSRLSRATDVLYLPWQVWIAIAATLALTFIRLATTERFTARHTVVTLGLGYGLVHFVGQRKGWDYHLYPLVAFAAVLLFAELAPAFAAPRPLFAASLVAGLVAIVVLVGVRGERTVDSGWIWEKERRVTALANDLGARTRPGDLVQVLDTTDGGLHALLRRRLAEPTRFLYDFHFFHHVDAPMIQRLRSEFVRDLTARPPALVVVMEAGWPTGGYERVDAFPALATLLATEYRLAREADGYRIYEKRHTS